MSNAKYQRLPTTDIHLKARRSSSLDTSTSASASSVTLLDNEDASERGSLRHLPAYDSDPRFIQPKPSPWARVALILFLVVAFYIAFMMRAEIFWSIVGQQEERELAASQEWADRVGGQDSY